MNTFFVSDQHFDHKNIIKYCERPFSDVDEMNEHMVETHNKMVTNKDIVYHVGDFCFSPNSRMWLNRLNGKEHHLVLGNHDFRHLRQLQEAFDSVQDVKLIRVQDSDIFLSHYCHLVWPKRHYGTYHLYGHSHGMLQGPTGSLDVGVDPHHFHPLPWEDVKDVIDNRIAQMKARKEAKK